MYLSDSFNWLSPVRLLSQLIRWSVFKLYPAVHYCMEELKEIVVVVELADWINCICF